MVVRGVGAGNGVSFTLNERRKWSVMGSISAVKSSTVEIVVCFGVRLMDIVHMALKSLSSIMFGERA